MERLVIEDGPDRGRHMEAAAAGSACIGRDPVAELSLHDTRASRHHARLERRPDGVWIVDLQSHNGTAVNGAPVREHRLQPGDRVRIGDTHLRWETEAAADAAATKKTLANRLQTFYHDRKAPGAAPAGPAGPRRAIAFDIEGTLLTTDGFAGEALEQTLRETCGVLRPLDGFTTAGRSETEIVRNALRAAGMPPERIREERLRILSRYISTLGNALSRRTPGRVLPGAKALLDRLAADPRWIVGLFTRNVQLGARILLGHYGLSSAFRFGVYADDAENPDALAGLLLVRAREAAGGPIALDAVLVGSSVRMIAVARGAGWRSLAVATGADTRETLAAQSPTLVVQSLENADDILARLAAAGEPASGPAPAVAPPAPGQA